MRDVKGWALPEAPLRAAIPLIRNRPMSKLLISYRRADTAAIAGRIRDRLALHFGEDRIFMDIDAIPIGVDFRTHLGRAVESADAVLVLIGDDWAGVRPDGSTRIKEDQDPIRMEVESALQMKRLVIPVLIDRAVMPAERDLPPGMSAFAFINAAHVDSGRDFNAHMERLIRALENSIGPAKAALAAKPSEALPVAGPKSAYRSRAILITSVLVLVMAALIAGLGNLGGGDGAATPAASGHRDKIKASCIAHPSPGLDCECFSAQLASVLTPPQQMVLLAAMEDGSTPASIQKAMDANGVTDPNFQPMLLGAVTQAASVCMKQSAAQ